MQNKYNLDILLIDYENNFFICETFIVLLILYFIFFLILYNRNNNVQPSNNLNNLNSNIGSPGNPEDPKHNWQKRLREHFNKYKIEYIAGSIIITGVVIVCYCYLNDINLQDITNYFKGTKPNGSGNGSTALEDADLVQLRSDLPESSSSEFSSDSIEGIDILRENLSNDSSRLTKIVEQKKLKPYNAFNTNNRLDFLDSTNTIDRDYNFSNRLDDSDLYDPMNSSETEALQHYLDDHIKQENEATKDLLDSFLKPERARNDSSLEELLSSVEARNNYINAIQKQSEHEIYMEIDKRILSGIEDEIQEGFKKKLEESFNSNFSDTHSYSYGSTLNEELNPALDREIEKMFETLESYSKKSNL